MMGLFYYLVLIISTSLYSMPTIGASSFLFGLLSPKSTPIETVLSRHFGEGSGVRGRERLSNLPGESPRQPSVTRQENEELISVTDHFRLDLSTLTLHRIDANSASA